MQLLLDVHLSPEKIGGPLADDGHDVTCAASDPVLRLLTDQALLEYATEHDLVVVTCDTADFSALHWERVRREIDTCGVLICTFPNNAYGPILQAIRSVLERWPDQNQWPNRLAFLARE